MTGRRFGHLGTALLVAGALGLAGLHGAAVNAHPLAADCKDPGMMSDQKMDMPGMMSDPMMAGPGMMGDPMVGDPKMDGTAMMNDPMMESPAMMAGKMLRARDGQCLASQSATVQALFVAVFGDGAGARWVQEHETELSRSGM